MVMSGRRRAFTLVELLMVIIIIGVLAGMMLAGADAMFGKSKATRCLNDRKILEKEYMLAKLNNYDGITGSSTDILGKIAENHNGQYTVGTITGICEADGSYDCITSDNDRMIKISCSEHKDEGAAEAATNPWDETYGTETDYAGTHYFRTATAGTRYYVNGNEYFVYSNLNKGNTKTNTEANIDIEFLGTKSDAPIVKIGEDKGEWSKSELYKKGDRIEYEEKIYIYIYTYDPTITDKRPPNMEINKRNSYWLRLA